MEKYGYNIIEQIKDFYPTFKQYLLESSDRPNIPTGQKIPNKGKVKAQDGTIIDMKVLDNEMESARTAIVSQSPLFAAYVHELTPIYTWLVPTMATDGIRLFVNPKFGNELTWEQKIFVILHEIMHCVLLHMERGKGFNQELFNIAADFEVNASLLDTISDFNEAFIKEIKGLYDEKYSQWPVEQIYREILSSMPNIPNNKGNNKGAGAGKGEGKGKGKGEPGGGGSGGNQPSQIGVGDKVKIKASGEIGQVSAINPDGTYEVGPIQESIQILSLKTLLNEGFTREEIIPISDDQGNGEGEGKGDSNQGDEQGNGAGGEDSDRDTTFDEENMGGTGSSMYDKIYEELDKMDPSGTGTIIDKELGDQIAKESGYDVEAGESGDAGIDVKGKWRELSSQVLDDLQKGKGAGKGQGSGLLKRLKDIHKSSVNWQSIFKRAVKKALSPEIQYRVPHKKHLGKDYVLRGQYQKRNAIQNVVVAVDVSGSMSDKTIEKIINEVNAMMFSKKVKKSILIPFDGGVDEKNIQYVTRSSRAAIKEYRGPGGGTNFQAPLDWVKEHLNDSVSLMVFFTDGIASMPQKPSYFNKFIWMVYDDPNFRQPFGQLVKLQTED